MSPGRSALVVQARAQACALPLSEVVETMRPLPISPMSGWPSFVPGIAVVRGRPTPVVDLGLLLGSNVDLPPTRFVTLRLATRCVPPRSPPGDPTPLCTAGFPKVIAVAVSSVRGIQTVADDAMTTLDGGLLLTVRAAELLPPEVWRSLGGGQT